jgi:3-dehydroquinate synthase
VSVSTVQVQAPSRPYEVVIGCDILADRISGAASALPGIERAVVISDSGVPERWPDTASEGLRSAGIEVSKLVFAGGESSKTLKTASWLLGEMARSGMHRGDLVVGVGGGVVTDLAGFVAATYMRGIGLIQVPTTLLGMVDASVGGKTGVNLEGWKNLVGAFYQPHAVIADLAALQTLPTREMQTGMAEVIKYGFIADPGIIDTAARLTSTNFHDVLARSGTDLVGLVRACVEVKASVVCRDEKESGTREILNFGHTLGHALERATSNSLGHGEAISVGMVFEAELSRLEGMADSREELIAALSQAGLPVSAEGVGREAILEAMALDKKYSKGLRFVLLESIGNPVVKVVEDSTKIDAALRSVGIA